MSIFQSILEKLGIRKEAAPTAPAAAAPKAAPPTGAPPRRLPTEEPAVAPAQPAPISMVDVVSKLESLAAKNPNKLNWKVSIADLLFLLGLDNSYNARKELAVELGCPENLMADSFQMNSWLHTTVLKKIAEHGGNIPPELLKH